MPERFRSEEEENRNHSLCQYGTVANRCSNCPRAIRTHLQNRRCPYDVEELEDPNKSLASSSGKEPEAESLSDEASNLLLANPTVSESSKVLSDEASKLSVADPSASETSSPAPRSLASSSGKGKEPETESLFDEASKLSLADLIASETSSATPGSLASSSSSEVPEAESLSVGALSLADSTASVTSSDTAGVPFQNVGSKRKLGGILQYQTTKADLKDRASVPFKEFPDPYPANKRLHQLMRISDENHEPLPSSMTTAVIPDFLLDINEQRVRATSNDMEVDETTQWNNMCR